MSRFEWKIPKKPYIASIKAQGSTLVIFPSNSGIPGASRWKIGRVLSSAWGLRTICWREAPIEDPHHWTVCLRHVCLHLHAASIWDSILISLMIWQLLVMIYWYIESQIIWRTTADISRELRCLPKSLCKLKSASAWGSFMSVRMCIVYIYICVEYKKNISTVLFSSFSLSSYYIQIKRVVKFLSQILDYVLLVLFLLPYIHTDGGFLKWGYL